MATRELAEQEVILQARDSLKAYGILYPRGRVFRQTRVTRKQATLPKQLLTPHFPHLNAEEMRLLVQNVEKAHLDKTYLALLKEIADESPLKYPDPKKTPPKYREIEPWYEYFSKSSILSVLGFKSRMTGSEIDETMVKFIDDDWCSKTMHKNKIFQTKLEIIDTIFNGEALGLKQLEIPEDIPETQLEMQLPLINEDAKFSVRKEIQTAVENYEISPPGEIKSVADIPLYFVLVIGAERAFHTTLLILIHNGVKTQMYSIGLGYNDGNKTDRKKNETTGYMGEVVQTALHKGFGALYSPDFLIKPSLKNKIVDIGILTSEHIKSLNEKFIEKSTSLISEIKILPTTRNTYGDTVPGSIISPSSTLNINLTYFGLSSNHTSWDNCTSFITKIFPHIDCQSGLPIVTPSLCTTCPKTTPLKIKNAYDFYMDDKYQQLIKLLEKGPENYCTVSGGKQRSRYCKGISCRGCGKTRKNKKK